MATGGFGGSPWGGSPWGGASRDTTFLVALAQAESHFTVLVEFDHNLNTLYAPNYAPSSYSIPGLTISAVVPGPNGYSVLLTTTEQADDFPYTVEVLDARDSEGSVIDPLFDTATFGGFVTEARTFFATAQSNTKVQLTFSVVMLQNAAYTNPANYTVTDLNGTSFPIASVTPVGPSPNRRVTLNLSAPLTPGGYYVATVASPPVLTDLLLVVPATDLFQWTETPKPAGVYRFDLKISDFSGEVTGGILGEPLGLVFFSPSLDVAAPNSAIQVDEVSVCTRAYDVYTPPAPIDPNPLYTWSNNGPAGNLGAGIVLFTTFDRLLGARLDLNIQPSDALGAYTDGPATATLAQPFDPAYVSLLNNPYWNSYPGTVTFITANNLGPIPPGPTIVITLQGSPTVDKFGSFGGDGFGGQDWG